MKIFSNPVKKPKPSPKEKQERGGKAPVLRFKARFSLS
jgi:hypothetical protein